MAAREQSTGTQLHFLRCPAERTGSIFDRGVRRTAVVGADGVPATGAVRSGDEGPAITAMGRTHATLADHRPGQLAPAFRYVTTDVPVGMTLADYRRCRTRRRRGLRRLGRRHQ
jgi:hypothetical protein